MAQRTSPRSNSPVALEAKAIVLAVLAALAFVSYVVVPVSWLALGTVVLAISAVGYRIESAVRSLSRA